MWTLLCAKSYDNLDTFLADKRTKPISNETGLLFHQRLQKFVS
jgi:hypothetical protein